MLQEQDGKGQKMLSNQWISIHGREGTGVTFLKSKHNNYFNTPIITAFLSWLDMIKWSTLKTKWWFFFLAPQIAVILPDQSILSSYLHKSFLMLSFLPASPVFSHSRILLFIFFFGWEKFINEQKDQPSAPKYTS